jgi:hypothetical protein
MNRREEKEARRQARIRSERAWAEIERARLKTPWWMKLFGGLAALYILVCISLVCLISYLAIRNFG